MTRFSRLRHLFILIIPFGFRSAVLWHSGRSTRGSTQTSSTRSSNDLTIFANMITESAINIARNLEPSRRNSSHMGRIIFMNETYCPNRHRVSSCPQVLCQRFSVSLHNGP